MRIRDVLIRLIGARDPNCPNEAEVLAYFENRISSGGRAQLEQHFSNCHNCIEVLAFLGRDTNEAFSTPTEEAVSEQTNRIFGYIQNDEPSRREPAKKGRPAAGFYISYPKLATVGLIISAIAIGIVLALIGGPDPSVAGMDALKLALKNERFTETRVSGGFDYSRYAGEVRGKNSITEGLHFDRAEGKVKSAAQDSSDVNSRLVLARTCLARGTPAEANRALIILSELSKSGVETPAVLNDLGVARFQLGNYDDAIVYFTRALAASPKYDEALFNRALAYGRSRRDAEARQDWQQFMNQSADENWKKEARAYLNRLTVPPLR